MIQAYATSRFGKQMQQTPNFITATTGLDGESAPADWPTV